ncbi:MAG: DNA polymerase III subunit beta [Candidatus Omnitrophica bacterium]|nr:DNA polymerase III subunit beta [Candidatus Omnitrophota bacterium]
MRIALEQPQLLKSLQVIEHAVNDRSALPILANVLLETKNQELVLTATDLDVGVRYQLPSLTIEEPGAVALPARRLTTIVRELPEESVTIEVKQNHHAVVSCGASRFRLPGLPPEDFPLLPPHDEAAALHIPQPALKALLQYTIFAMSLEETRFVLNGALLKTHAGALTLAATDGRRLAVATGKGTPQEAKELAVVVPSKTIRELARLLQDDEEAPVSISPLKDNQLLFRFGAVTVVTRLIEGQFPPYDSVIPPPSASTVTCPRQLLADAVRRASLMTTATSQAVVFELAKDALIVSKESAELGSAREEVPAAYRGEPMTIAFNPEFWLEALKVLPQEDVVIEVTAPDKPAVVRLPARPGSPGAGGPDFLYVVLPMKLA